MNTSSLVKRAKQLKLHSLSIAEGMRSGGFRSLSKGQGIEFSGVRDYIHGDDVRSIDWNVTARMGKPYVKLFDEEKELNVFFIVDRSLSMETGSEYQSRMQAASEAGALLLFAAEQISSPVGAVFFDGKIRFSCEPKSGQNQTLLLLSRFDRPEEKILEGSVLANAIKGASKILKKRSLVIILSDFRSSGYEDELAMLSLKHDVIAIRFTDNSDTDIPDVGYASFSDLETNIIHSYPTSNTNFKRSWREYGQNHIKRWKSMCLKRGVKPMLISTTEDVALSLTRFFH